MQIKKKDIPLPHNWNYVIKIKTMKNEKYIAPEMEVVEVKIDASLLSASCATDSSNIPETPHCQRLSDYVA